MIRELRGICRTKGIKGSLLFFALSAVIFFTLRKDIWLVLVFKSLEFVEKKDIFFFMGGMAVLLLLFAIWSLIGSLSAKSVKKIDLFLQNHPEYTLADLEADFKDAQVYDGTFFFGRRFLIYVDAGMANVLLLSDVVWAYQKSTTKKGYTMYHLVIHTADKKYYEITLKGGTVPQILGKLEIADSPVIIGYSDQLKKLYQSGPANFAVQVERSPNPGDA